VANGTVFRVEVEMNLVRAVAPHELQPGEAIVAPTNLEAGTQAASNFQRNGSLDGTYFFADLRQARLFARLCLEFMRLLVDRRLATLTSLPPSAPFFADPRRPECVD
jgi:hypothetical protein